MNSQTLLMMNISISLQLIKKLAKKAKLQKIKYSGDKRIKQARRNAATA